MSSTPQPRDSRRLSNGCRIRVEEADLTRLQVDAIVNAANSSLMGGGGVDGAIHRAGGPKILEECRDIVARQGRCAPGAAVITSAGRMPSRFVIHTVGPIYQGRDDQDAATLSSCYRESLERAIEHGCASIAFPSISTGAYGYPLEKAAPVALETVVRFLQEHGAPAEVVFCTFGSRATALYRQLVGRVGAPEGPEPPARS